MRLLRIGLAALIMAGLLLALTWISWPKVWQGTFFLPSSTVPRQTEEGISGDKALPWAGDPRVQELLQRHNTPILMAYYHARLPDPILWESYNVTLAAKRLAGTVLQPGEIFSQNKLLGPYTKARGYRDGPMFSGNKIVPSEGGGVCKIASGLYNAAILANLEIIERHPHSLTVPYVPPGQDATVAYGFYDFRFRNNTGAPLVIWADTVGDTLYIAFYGRQKPPKVTWHHEVLERVKTWTEYTYNPSLPPGTQKVIFPGQDGITVHSWITIEYPDGKIVRKDLGISRYQASPRLVERGPA
ncbi:VanW family protein [Moorellaceae bacterium AZ2]